MEKEEEYTRGSQDELNELTYIISHDLQEPLRMITSYVQLLNKRYNDKLDDNARDYIRYAVEGTNRLKKMMDDLLIYSRIGRPVFKRENADARILIEQIEQSINNKYKDKSYKISTRYNNVKEINADKELFKQLIYHLIDNSIKFNRENKTEIDLIFNENSNHWEITVSDNGIGINKEYHGKIFGIFQRLHNQDEYPGSGMGLAICEKIVNLHKGRITIDSETGRGTKFKITIKKEKTEF